MDLGRSNRRAVLSEIALGGAVSRTKIAKTTGLTLAAVSRITRDLIEAGILIELPDVPSLSGTETRSPGRKTIQLSVNASGGYVLGIGVNAFYQSVTLADLHNQRIYRTDLDFTELSDPDVVIEKLIEASRYIIENKLPDPTRLLGAAIAITGAVDSFASVVKSSPYLGWGEVDIAGRLRNALGIPVHIESLPAAVALAEAKFGIAKGIQNLLTVNCSLGIAAAILADGQLIRGENFSAGLIGSVELANHNNATLDRLAGGKGILETLHAGAITLDQLTSSDLAKLLLQVLEQARSKNGQVTSVVRNAGQLLGQTLSPFLSLLSPKAILISGPLAGSALYSTAVEECLQNANIDLEKGVLISQLTAQAAARWVAIDTFLLQRDLDIDALKQTMAA